MRARGRSTSRTRARIDARVALLAHVRGGARAELAHALEQVLLPREQDDRHVPERDVAVQRAREGEAVHAGHEDVADDELGLDAEGEVERGGAVERLVHLAAGGAQQVGDEPGDARIVVRHDDAPAVEAHVRAGASTAPGHSLGRRGTSWCSHGASAMAPSGASPPKRTAPPVLCETISCTRAMAPHSAPSTSVPSPSGTRHERAVPVDAVDEAALQLFREPVGELLERRLAKGDPHRATFARVEDLFACACGWRRVSPASAAPSPRRAPRSAPRRP